jgi:hypothetical protein
MEKQENTSVVKAGKKLWHSPWFYLESFIIATILILVGFVVEYIFQAHQVPLPQRPYNLIILFSSILFLSIVHVLFGKTGIIKWFSSIPCSISSIIAYAFLVMLLGFIKQNAEGQPQWVQQLGLNHLKNSWPFLFIEVYLFGSLGMVVLRRSYPFTRKNFGFLLNHFGLWLTLMAAALGSGDLQRLRVNLFENGDFFNKGLKAGHEIYTLPFSLKLLDFKMEIYNPKIMLSDSIGNLPEKLKGEAFPVIESGSEYLLKNYNIKILKVIPTSEKTDSGYVPSNKPMAAAAALVNVTNITTGKTLTNWLCSGSTMMLPRYILLEKNLGLWLLKPEPKKYASELVIKNKKGVADTVYIEVNKPYKIFGWSFYQIDYDEKMGPASNLSVIEAVYDPWLPVIYLGIVFMIAGALYIFWLGRSVKTEI